MSMLNLDDEEGGRLSARDDEGRRIAGLLDKLQAERELKVCLPVAKDGK